MRRTLVALLVPVVLVACLSPGSASGVGGPQGTTELRGRDAFPGAHRLLAGTPMGRPTDGSSDPYGDGYRAPSTKKCSLHFCLHWVTRTDDRPSSQAWVDTTLTQLNRVWSFEVGRLGYRAPLPDGERGGNSKFDVYLADVGSKGYYGYCAPEKTLPGNHSLADGFCVLDNDFATSQFGAPPMVSLKVTAAHEFFHAIQYAYDVNEDRWMMEATATWMEERFADDANDNRQYLPHGQLGQPGVPLDKFGFGGTWQYGNWLFFEFLSQRYGVGVVRAIWRQAAAFAGAPHSYSLGAIRTVLKAHSTTLPREYAVFSGVNQIPAEFYSEGADYQPAPVGRTLTLSEASPSTGAQTTHLEHLSSRTIEVTPDPALIAPTQQVQIGFDLPDTARGAAAYVIVKRTDGTVLKSLVTLDAHGLGTLVRPFSAATVTSVLITLANGSSRSTCQQGTQWACRGTPLDDGLPFTWHADLVPAG